MADRKLQVVITGDASSLNRAFGQAQSATQRIGTKMTAVGGSLTRGLTLPLVAAAGAAAKTAIDFETAFTGVTKTVDGTDRQLNKIRNGIRQMAKEIPATTTEIAAVAEAAGALGIKTNAILGFTRTMIDLGETTDLTADQAATSFARIANVMGTAQGDFDRLGSTVVDLGNNGESTESEITEMAQRIAAAGKIAGIAESDLLGIASALANVGVKAESGGTAAQKVLNGLSEAVATSNDDLATFAATAGMSAKEFQAAWKDDAASAFASFVAGLGKAGDGAFQILRDLGLANERTITAFLSLANSGDNLTDSLETGRKAWKQNTALAEEAQKRYRTTAAGMEILRNNVADLAISMSKVLLPAIRRLVARISGAVKWFSNLSSGTKKAILVVAGLVAALGPLLIFIGKLTVAITVLGGPVTAAIAAMAAFAAGLVYAYKTSASFRKAVNQLASSGRDLWNAIQPLIAQIGGQLQAAFSVIGPVLRGVVIPALASFIGQISTIVSIVSSAIGALSSLQAKMSSMSGAIGGLRSAVTSAIPGAGIVRSISNIIGPRPRAHGGNVAGGRAYLVGERGPELVVPTSAGSVMPNHKLGGGTTYNFNIYTDGTQDGRKVAQVVQRELENQRKRNSRHDRTRGAA